LYVVVGVEGAGATRRAAAGAAAAARESGASHHENENEAKHNKTKEGQRKERKGKERKGEKQTGDNNWTRAPRSLSLSCSLALPSFPLLPSCRRVAPALGEISIPPPPIFISFPQNGLAYYFFGYYSSPRRQGSVVFPLPRSSRPPCCSLFPLGFGDVRKAEPPGHVLKKGAEGLRTPAIPCPLARARYIR
jgi:hypothetical protein